jgi:hypothetical protein
VGKTVCEKTSLLPRSCAVSSHLAAVSVSPLTCGSPAIGKGSLSGPELIAAREQVISVQNQAWMAKWGENTDSSNPGSPPVPLP